jgi:hypothetical protein
MVAYRTDAAKPLDKHGNFPVRPALNETLKSAELDNVQPSLSNLIVFVKQNGDFAVSLNSGYRFYYYSFVCTHFIAPKLNQPPPKADSTILIFNF